MKRITTRFLALPTPRPGPGTWLTHLGETLVENLTVMQHGNAMESSPRDEEFLACFLATGTTTGTILLGSRKRCESCRSSASGWGRRDEERWKMFAVGVPMELLLLACPLLGPGMEQREVTLPSCCQQSWQKSLGPNLRVPQAQNVSELVKHSEASI